MAEWRQRGYVPDSDDEEDTVESQQQERQAPVPTPSPSRDRLESPVPLDRLFDSSQDTGLNREHGRLPDSRTLSCTSVASPQVPEAYLTEHGDYQIQTCARDTLVGGDGEIGSISKPGATPVDHLSADGFRSAFQTSSAGLLEERLDFGLKTVAEVLQSARIDGHILSSSNTSSPLSSVHSSQTSLISMTSPAIESTLAPFTESLDLNGKATAPPPTALEARRALRRRAPIQQNPYTLEAAQYQQSLKARGIKPVRILLQESTGDSNDNGESQGGQQSSSCKSPRDSSHSTQPRRREHSNGESSPDLGDWLISGREKIPRLSYKRRKLDHSKGYHDPSLIRDYNSIFDFPDDENDQFPNQNLEDGLLNRDEDDDLLMFDVPSSRPEPDLPHPTVVTDDGFRVPRGLTPPTMHSRNTSNMKISDPSAAIDINTSSDDSGGSEQEASDDGKHSHAEHPEDDTQRIEGLQRKIKGVLPASWLRLDRMKRDEPFQKSRELSHVSPSKQIKSKEIKGVAHKVRKLMVGRKGYRDFDELLSDSSSDDSISARKSVQSTQLRQARLDALDFFDDDIQEEDSIDSMAPPITRSTPGVKSKRSASSSNAHGLARGSTSAKAKDMLAVKAQKRPRNTTKHPRQLSLPSLSSRTHPSVVGILDATDLGLLPRSQQPRFLKVAARQARSRKDKSRHTPNRKVIQLAHNEDNRDARKVLKQWKNGRLPRRPEETPHGTRNIGRVPLKERAVNEQLDQSHDSPLSPDSNALARPTNRLIAEILAREKRNPLQPTAPNWDSSRIVGMGTPESSAARKSGLVHRPRRRLGNLMPRLHTLGMRDAQIERQIEGSYERQSSSRFSKTLAALNRNTTRTVLHSLNDHDPKPITNTIHPVPETGQDALPREARARRKFRRPRKSIPRQTGFAAIPVNQTKLPLIRQQESISRYVGRATTYSMDFGLLPLSTGTCLDRESFVGSGKLASIFGMPVPDHDNEPVAQHRQMAEEPAVTDQLPASFGALIHHLDGVIAHAEGSPSQGEMDNGENLATAITHLEQALAWLSHNEQCSDAAGIERIPSLSLKVAEDLEVSWERVQITSNRHLVRVIMRLAALSHAAYAYSLRGCSNAQLEDLTSAYEKLLMILGPLAASESHMKSLYNLLVTVRATRDQKLDCWQHPQLDALVLVHHLLDTAPLPTRWATFWDFYNDCILRKDTPADDLEFVETCWKDLFVTATVMAIGPLGHVHDLATPAANWMAVKLLLSRAQVLPLSSDSHGKSPPFYSRTAYQRCHVLAQTFRWGNPELILDLLYDVFRRRGLKSPAEEHYSYPAFLDNLTEQTKLQPDKADSSFQSMLKLIAFVVRDLASQKDSDSNARRRLKNLLFRLVPNNGHVSSKYDEVEEQSLTPLKNHHDLLTVLYCAAPAQYRPRLQRFEDLVDFSESHLSACRISLRTWGRLVTFQVSTPEPLSTLGPLSRMLESMVQAMLQQHRQVSHEVQGQREGWSDEHVTSIIRYNKCQLERFVLEILETQIQVVKACREDEQAVSLVTKETIGNILGLFSARSHQCDELYLRVFELVLALVARTIPVRDETSELDKPSLQVNSRMNEDSQEYGDWSGLEALMDQPQLDSLQYINSAFFPNLFRFTCDAIGSDEPPASDILEELLSCWTSIIHGLATSGLHNAGNLVSQQHHESWVWFRNTPQKRLYYPLFIAHLTDKLGASFYSENRANILEGYIKSLAEPDCYHVWLPRLTQALLSHHEPFLRSSSFSLVQNISAKRLLSTIMLNIRASRMSQEQSAMARELMMALLISMKAHYKEIGHHNERQPREEYVEFVRDVLEQMSIYLPGYRKMESFFNEPSTFPQPASSVYISLRQYSLNLETQSSQKPLITFLYNVLERAALDDNQTSLQEQIVTAINDAECTTIELQSQAKCLQHFLLRCVFPAYIEQMFTEYGHCLIPPILETIRNIYKTVLPTVTEIGPGISVRPSLGHSFSTPLVGFGNVLVFLQSTASLLDSFHATLQQCPVDLPTLELMPHTVDAFCNLFSTVAYILPPIDFLIRDGVALSEQAEELLGGIVDALEWFDCFVSGMAHQVTSTSTDSGLLIDGWPDLPLEADSMLAFTRAELASGFQGSWSRIPGRGIFINKYNSPREVVSAQRIQKCLRSEIEAVGSISKWTRWTIWAACHHWAHNWNNVDRLGRGNATFQSEFGSHVARELKDESTSLVPGMNGEEWRLFFL